MIACLPRLSWVWSQVTLVEELCLPHIVYYCILFLTCDAEPLTLAGSCMGIKGRLAHCQHSRANLEARLPVEKDTWRVPGWLTEFWVCAVSSDKLLGVRQNTNWLIKFWHLLPSSRCLLSKNSPCCPGSLLGSKVKVSRVSACLTELVKNVKTPCPVQMAAGLVRKGAACWQAGVVPPWALMCCPRPPTRPF